MARRRMRTTRNYAAAAEAVAINPDLTDEEIESRLADCAPAETGE